MDGITLLKERLKNLPAGPGVYRMLNDKNEVLYVGKAKNLKHRVSQYTQPERMGGRIRKMVFETRELVIVSTATEAEALLLEANLIKSLKPRYNILFRDDSSYVSVLITHEETPLIRSFRGARKIPGDYFGPYPSALAVYQTLDLMERAFRLRTCSPGFFRHRTRPCLKYDIKRCSGPCVGKIAPDKYAQSVARAKRFLRGETQSVLADLQMQMADAAQSLDYERAAELRDAIRALSSVGGADRPSTHALAEADVFALAESGGRVQVQIFSYRHGQHVGNQALSLAGLQDEGITGLQDEGITGLQDSRVKGLKEEQPEGSLAEVLRLFLAQYYTSRPVPPLILTSVAPADAEALAEALSTSAGRKVELSVPSRGDRAEVVRQATQNARDALSRQLAEGEGWQLQMAALAQMLNLTKPISCLECYDISNISGKMPVASLVVAGPEGMLRNRYRRYAIKGKDTPDDYAMMAEVLERRLYRGLKEGGLPDVIMVDGGKGQLNILIRVAQKLGLLGHPNCPTLAAIAKGEERNKGLETIFVACATVPLPPSDISAPDALPPSDTLPPQTDSDASSAHPNCTINELPIFPGTPLIFVLQRIRDEAHRFAITYHRKKRENAISHSRLDDIPGIGPRKKKELLLRFGSVRGVESASLAQLREVPGLSQKLAQQIYDFFHI